MEAGFIGYPCLLEKTDVRSLSLAPRALAQRMGPRDATEGTNQGTLHSLVACPQVVPTAGIPLDNSCHPETCSQHSGWPGGVSMAGEGVRARMPVATGRSQR